MRFAAVQVPPHDVPVPAQGVFGIVTATHVPLLAGLTQDSHCPAQATLQQTPSALHTPLAQSWPLPVHVSPLLLPTQVPLEQMGVFPLHPPQHCAFAIQPALQGFCPLGQFEAQLALPAWQPSAQVIAVGAEQEPLPLQSAAVVAVPVVHEAAAPHDVALVGNTQAARAVPSQRPAQAPVPPHGARGVVTATQVPRLAGLMHDSHCPLHSALQQTPSAPHTPLEHSVAAAHAVPLVFVVVSPLPLAPAVLAAPAPALPPLPPPGTALSPLMPAPEPPAGAPPPFSLPP